MKASVNYVGKSSMIIGIRSENIRTGTINTLQLLLLYDGFKDKDGKTRKSQALFFQFRRSSTVH
jgi:hypothetical protein